MTRNIPDPGYCAYGAIRIRERIGQLAGEIEGVRKAEDIEAIHRMRVASRRIRAALPLFSCCIPRKKYLRWTREIRDITRALGAARDKDVQIEFLTGFRKRFPAFNGEDPGQEYLALFHNPAEPCVSEGGDTHREPCIVPRQEYGIDCLLLRYHQERMRLQAPVNRALRHLEKDKALKEMDAFFRKRESGEYPDTSFGYRIASKRIGFIITELRKYAESLSDAGRKDDHHQMRIIAKQLRYTMELYGDLYEGGLKPEIQKLRHLQDLLGEIHDCDVWTDSLPRFLKEEAGRVESYFGRRDFLRLVEPGIENLLADRISERQDLFRKLGLVWRDLEGGMFWENLLQKVHAGSSEREEPVQRSPKLPRTGKTDPLVEKALALQSRYPYGGDHSRNVCSIALSLFDELSELHHGGKSSRRILECAAILHDIGWVSGRDGHQKTSAKLILEDTTLPLKPGGRAILALVVQGHRGKFPESGISLSAKDISKAGSLAALLRIADGLDVTHQGIVKIQSCEIHDHLVRIHIVSPMNPELEISAALRKGDLLKKISGYDLEIVREENHP